MDNKLHPLDMLKVIPVTMSALVADGIGQMINPLMYSDAQHYIYLASGAIVGGLWAFSVLGSFAKAGNAKAIVKWSIPLAMVWAFEAPIVQSKLLDIIVDPHYSSMKHELLKSIDIADTTELKNKLISINEKLSDVNTKIENKKLSVGVNSKEKAVNIYLSNYKTKDWWKIKESEIGCIKGDTWLNNNQERARRIACIEDSILLEAVPVSLIKDKNMLNSKALILKNKISSIENIGAGAVNKYNDLKRDTSEIEIYIPIIYVYIFMFFFGWGVEAGIAQLKFWINYVNAKAKIKGHLLEKNDLTEKKAEVINERIILEREKIETMLLSISGIEEFMKDTLKTNEILTRHNSFFTVLRAIQDIVPEHLGKQSRTGFNTTAIQRYSIFANPTDNKPFSVTHYQMKIREILMQKNAVRIENFTNEFGEPKRRIIYDYRATKSALKEVHEKL